MKKYCWIFFIFVLRFGYGQPGTQVNKEINIDGNCYINISKDIYETHEETYPVFTGDKKPRGVRLKRKTLVLKEPITKWIKKKADRNCLSADPNDCTVWCLVESVPGETAHFQYVKNTSKTTEFEMQTFTVYTKIKTEFEEVQVVCKSDIDDALIKNVQSRLSELGYFIAPNIKVNMFDKIKSALSNYQNDNDLPIGHFDYQTLNHLNIVKELYLK